MDTNYFVCTLGQAVLVKQNRNIENVTQFIDHQAKNVPQLHAVGFFHNSENWATSVLKYKDLQSSSQAVADILLDALPDNVAPGQTIALLCPSNADFLFTWLALMRLGHPVLLLAPQCSSSAVASLCKTCGVSLLLYDKLYEDLAEKSTETKEAVGTSLFQAHPIPSIEAIDLFSIGAAEGPERDHIGIDADPRDVAYLHHTSGTSTGIPKPIPQSHRAAIGVLPRLKGSGHATFSTTPLYHGGIADLFRAWTSDAMIWLFPEKGLPITAGNVVQCLGTAAQCTETQKVPPIKYFSSVPYVLQMMASDKRGMQHLRKMDMVGVGGAALPSEVGDDLVRTKVNLISRFGSAECGFLMSSHRNYEKDKEWQYLRSDEGGNMVKFELQPDGLAELVVLPSWPHMAKTNREDGSYATADLFAPHPNIPNAWRYHSRADSQLTLITGKKFDPAPLESAIAASPLLDDVLIFGDGKPYPGALLFRSLQSRHMLDKDVIAQLAPTIEKLNGEAQSHARIPRNMLVPMGFVVDNLEKSSKGTVIRRKAQETYSKEIEEAYLFTALPNGKAVLDEDVTRTILEIVESVVGKQDDLNAHTDLFSYGVDSVACVQIRHSLMQLVPYGTEATPLTIVEDCETVEGLSQYVLRRRRGQLRNINDSEDEHQLMRDLVDNYSKFESSEAPNIPQHNAQSTNGDGQPTSSTKSQHPAAEDVFKVAKIRNREVVVLTGATGALGAHVLDLYRKSEKVSKIYCLVRGADDAAAQERANKALEQRKLTPLRAANSKLNVNERCGAEVVVIRARLGDPNLGLSHTVYHEIASEATIIVHLAWAVNFRLGLRSFVKDHIVGTRNIINLALSSPHATTSPRLAFCSSVASVANFHSSATVPEAIINDPSTASQLGYSRSKWVAEQICQYAESETRLKGRIAVFRVGQLSGATVTGIWNAGEAWPLMLSSAKFTGCLPALQNEPLSWLPVDVAAMAFVQGVENMGAWMTKTKAEHMQDGGEMRVYHIVNDDCSVDWMDFLHWIGKHDADTKFEIVAPKLWLERMEAVEAEQDIQRPHPAMKLLAHWQKAYGEDTTALTATGGQGGEKTPMVLSSLPRYAMDQTREIAPIMRSVGPVSEEYAGKVWRWIQDAV